MAKKKTTKESTEPKPADSAVPAAKDMKLKADALKEDMDKLIDEIDDVLEKNAEKFVKDYIQRGGE